MKKFPNKPKLSSAIWKYHERPGVRLCFFDIEDKQLFHQGNIHTLKDKNRLINHIVASELLIENKALEQDLVTIKSSCLGDIYEALTDTIIPESFKKKYKTIKLSSYFYYSSAIEAEMYNTIIDNYPELNTMVNSKRIHIDNKIKLSQFERELFDNFNHIDKKLSSIEKRVYCDYDELKLIDLIMDLDFFHLYEKFKIAQILENLNF